MNFRAQNKKINTNSHKKLVYKDSVDSAASIEIDSNDSIPLTFMERLRQDDAYVLN